MKVYYDDEADVFYLKLGDEPPEGVIEITEGVNSQRAARLRGRGIKPRPWQGDTPLTPGIRFPAYKAGLITLVNLDTTSEDKIVGCEILKASKRIDLKTILSYTLEVEKDLITQKST